MFNDDNQSIILSYPVKRYNLFRFYYTKIIFYSSWMPLFLLFPMVISYIKVGQLNYFYILLKFIIFYFFYVGISVSIGILLSLIILKMLPIKHKNILILLGVVLIIFLVFIFRQLQPEKFLNPENFPRLIDYFNEVQIPGFSVSPALWFYNITFENNQINEFILYFVLLTFTFIILYLFSKHCFYILFYKILNKLNVNINKLNIFDITKYKIYKNSLLMLIKKEFNLLLRDKKNIPQYLIVLAVIIIYIYNFKLLPVKDIEKLLKPVFVIFNCLMSSFVIVTLTGRFILPVYAKDKYTEWFIKSTPYPVIKIFYIRILIYILINLVFGICLVFFSNEFLNIQIYKNIKLTLLNLPVIIFVIIYGLYNSIIFSDSINPDTGGMNIYILIFMLKTLLLVLITYIIMGYYLIFQFYEIKNYLYYYSSLTFSLLFVFYLIYYNLKKCKKYLLKYKL
jgi:ABC-2 type transport system permease protein